MTDETERKVRAWAVKRNGDELKPKDVVELALAVDEDAVSRHRQILDVVEPLATEFTAHCVENERRFSELDARQGITVEQARTLISAEHSTRHHEHVRDLHQDGNGDAPPAHDEETSRRVWVMWGVGIWLGTVVGSVLISQLVSYALHP